MENNKKHIFLAKKEMEIIRKALLKTKIKPIKIGKEKYIIFHIT